jgi:glutathione S-transferase
MQIRLFHLQNSRSQRIVWFLEELGLPYELVINHHSNVDEKKNSPHQLAKFPTLEMIDQGKISILAETSAILDYLSYLYPQWGQQHLFIHQLPDFYYWKNYSEATFIPDLLLKQIFNQIVQRTTTTNEYDRWTFRRSLMVCWRSIYDCRYFDVVSITGLLAK